MRMAGNTCTMCARRDDRPPQKSPMPYSTALSADSSRAVIGSVCHWPSSRYIALPNREGRPVRSSMLSAHVMVRRPKFAPIQRSGSGSHDGLRCDTHGSLPGLSGAGPAIA